MDITKDDNRGVSNDTTGVTTKSIPQREHSDTKNVKQVSNRVDITKDDIGINHDTTGFKTNWIS